jgi:hypothetical protein
MEPRHLPSGPRARMEKLPLRTGAPGARPRGRGAGVRPNGDKGDPCEEAHEHREEKRCRPASRRSTVSRGS